MSTERRGREAFTLIEMLITMAILGIVLAALASVYTIMARGMLTSTARSSVLEELNVTATQVASDLRALAQNHQSDSFALRGIDSDGQFENSTKTAHNNLSTDPNNHSDRLHVHAFYSDSQLDLDSMASDRVYYAYWINGETSDKSRAGLSNRYGLVKRRSKHSRTDLRDEGASIPYIENYSSGDSVPSPLMDLNQSNTNLRGLEVLGINIDYFSVRYYDPVNSKWRDCWDTRDDTTCSHTGDDGGRYPSVIQFAIRAYDRRANDKSGSENLIEPVWYQTAVSIRGKN